MDQSLAALHNDAIDATISARSVALQITQVCSICADTMPEGQAIALIAPLASALTSAIDCALELDAVAMAIGQIIGPPKPLFTPQDDAEQALALRELIEATGVRLDQPPSAAVPAETSVEPPSTHPPSCCIICHRTGDELLAHGIGWHRPGLCMQCGRAEQFPAPSIA